MIKVMIVDDDIEAARALKRNIDGQDGISVITVLDNGAEAVERCDEDSPDIVLMDAKMPGMSGIDACREIKRKHPAVKVLILTFYQVRENEVNALRNGCDGYLYKGHRSEELIAIIRSTFGGFATFENGVKNMIHLEMSSAVPSEANIEKLDKLTEREIEIARLVTAGKKGAEIAQQLYVSEGYVRNQLVTIREKLGVRNNMELAALVAKAGL